VLLLLLLAAALGVVALLLWSVVLRTGDIAAAVAALREEFRDLAERLALAEGPTPVHLHGPLNVESEQVLFTEEDLLSLGRSIALQLYRGERTPGTLSRAEERAVRLFRRVAGDGAPKGVPLARRGT
jgi:hypothetical protein